MLAAATNMTVQPAAEDLWVQQGFDVGVKLREEIGANLVALVCG